jgi:dCTP deaminase
MTLTKAEIIARLNIVATSQVEPIVVTPLLDTEDQIGIAGVDVRLGKHFIVFRQHSAGVFSPVKGKTGQLDIEAYQEVVIKQIRESIILHPGQLIIGSTLEYVSLPSDIECQLEGRSSWARLGLVIATASTVEPGYKGVVTLELRNSGTIPLKLFPGLKIAQLVFHTCAQYKMSEKELSKKKYQCAIAPDFSKVSRDSYLEYFCTGESR